MTDRVLIVDDDERLAEMLRTYLEGRGFSADVRHSGLAGLEAAVSSPPDLVVLDVMLPDVDGFEVLRRLRAASAVPVVMLTARGDETDRIVGLEIGADDYLPKPFNPRELLARIRAILRRQVRAVGPGEDRTLRFGRLAIDRAARQVRLDGAPRELTAHQFDILVALAERAGRVMTRDALMQAVRGHELDAFDRSIDVHVSRIRAAIEDDPAHPRRIRTVRGVGYVFVEKQP